MRPALWLFDIDGTLVDTGGAGLRALEEAATELFGDPGPELDLAGSTDSGIVGGMLAHFGRQAAPAEFEAFYESYLGRLEWNLVHGGFAGRVLPGASELLERLTQTGSATLGLLTGNIAGGAALKIRHYGLDRHFAFGAYGCDDPDRNKLGPIALSRAEQHAGQRFAAAQTLVIGDTPKDVACAKAIGAPCLAVATGRFSVHELREAGADGVVEGLDAVPDRFFEGKFDPF